MMPTNYKQLSYDQLSHLLDGGSVNIPVMESYPDAGDGINLRITSYALGHYSLKQSRNNIDFSHKTYFHIKELQRAINGLMTRKV